MVPGGFSQQRFEKLKKSLWFTNLLFNFVVENMFVLVNVSHVENIFEIRRKCLQNPTERLFLFQFNKAVQMK